MYTCLNYNHVLASTGKLPSRSSVLAQLALLYSLETTWLPAKVRSPFKQASYFIVCFVSWYKYRNLFILVSCFFHSDVTETASLSSCCKLLLQFMLNSLHQCGDNYLPVFKFIHSLCCGGEGFLTPEEMALLLQHCKVEPGEVATKGRSVCVRACARAYVIVLTLLPNPPPSSPCVFVYLICMPQHVRYDLNFAELAFLFTYTCTVYNFWCIHVLCCVHFSFLCV